MKGLLFDWVITSGRMQPNLTGRPFFVQQSSSGHWRLILVSRFEKYYNVCAASVAGWHFTGGWVVMNRSINAQVNCSCVRFWRSSQFWRNRIKIVHKSVWTVPLSPVCTFFNFAGSVRVIQHELSHNFGCVDGECTTGSSCIMNGGFDNNSSYNLSNIWCSNCIADFDASLHWYGCVCYEKKQNLVSIFDYCYLMRFLIRM